jgi:hypothetical protein
MMTSKSTAGDGERAPSAGDAVTAADAARNERRLRRFMVGKPLPRQRFG